MISVIIIIQISILCLFCFGGHQNGFKEVDVFLLTTKKKLILFFSPQTVLAFLSTINEDNDDSTSELYTNVELLMKR